MKDLNNLEMIYCSLHELKDLIFCTLETTAFSTKLDYIWWLYRPYYEKVDKIRVREVVPKLTSFLFLTTRWTEWPSLIECVPSVSSSLRIFPPKIKTNWLVSFLSSVATACRSCVTFSVGSPVFPYICLKFKSTLLYKCFFRIYSRNKNQLNFNIKRRTPDLAIVLDLYVDLTRRHFNF